MKCEYWWLDHMTEGNPLTHCENEAAAYFTCDFIDAVVCEKCRCRCYKTCPPMTEEEIKEFVEARDERRAKKSVDKKK